MKWDVDFTDFQWKFLSSTARFVNMTAAWATGKTMTAIAKGMTLSALYPGNKGLILRKNMTDLRDSTMSDFMTYTGLKVKVQSKTCTVSNGRGYPVSEIIFHHVDELAGVIQNINLGWFFIEQAEELDTDDVFEKLGGRLRRVLTPKKEVQQQLVDMGCLDEVLDDWVSLGYEKRMIAESALITELGQPLRQGFLIANANGHNWNWRKFINEGSDECILGRKFEVKSRETGKIYNYGKFAETVQATTFDNEHNIPADFLASQLVKKETAPSHYRRYVLNSHEDVDTADRCIPYQKILDAVDRDVRDYASDDIVISCDPAEFGDDQCVIYVFKGLKVIDFHIFSKKPHMETAGHIYSIFRKHHASRIIVDDIGEGAGVRSRLRELVDEEGLEGRMIRSGGTSNDINKKSIVFAFKSGRAADDKEHYIRLRDEVWMHAAQLFKDDYVSIPKDEKLIEDLSAFTYGMNSKGQIQVAPKKDIKEILARSPDRGDALVMGLWAAKNTIKPVTQPLKLAAAQSTYDPLNWGLD